MLSGISLNRIGDSAGISAYGPFNFSGQGLGISRQSAARSYLERDWIGFERSMLTRRRHQTWCQITLRLGLPSNDRVGRLFSERPLSSVTPGTVNCQ